MTYRLRKRVRGSRCPVCVLLLPCSRLIGLPPPSGRCSSPLYHTHIWDILPTRNAICSICTQGHGTIIRHVQNWMFAHLYTMTFVVVFQSNARCNYTGPVC